MAKDINIFGTKAKNIKERYSRVRECPAKIAYGCSGKFIKTHEGQENCLMCERLVLPTLHIAMRQEETAQAEQHFLDKPVVGEASLQAIGGNVESREYKP